MTNQYVYLVKAKLGVTDGVIGVFNNRPAAERLAEFKYREWTHDEKFIWRPDKTAQTINAGSDELPLNGHIVIAEYQVREK